MVRPRQINLIPKGALKKPFFKEAAYLYKKNLSLRVLSAAAATVILVSVIQALTAAYLGFNLAASKTALREAKIKIGKMQTERLRLEKTKEALAKEEAQRTRRLELLLSTSSKDKRYSYLLGFIASLTPEDLWINRLSLNEDQIEISGSTLNNQLIHQFMSALDESKAFKNSRFVSSEKQVADSHTIYNFQISAEPLWEKG